MKVPMAESGSVLSCYYPQLYYNHGVEIMIIWIIDKIGLFTGGKHTEDYVCCAHESPVKNNVFPLRLTDVTIKIHTIKYWYVIMMAYLTHLLHSSDC